MRRFPGLLVLSTLLSCLPGPAQADDDQSAPPNRPDAVEIMAVPPLLATSTMITDDTVEQYACVYRTSDPRIVDALMAAALAARAMPQYPVEQPRHVEIRNKLVFRAGTRVQTTVSFSRLYRNVSDLTGTWNRAPVHLRGELEAQVRAIVRREHLQQLREHGPETCGSI